MFMYHLLQQMEFSLITGFGESMESFKNIEDKNRIGQGMLQGSSSAPLIYKLASDVSLTTYA
jgi:hypothetical protein